MKCCSIGDGNGKEKIQSCGFKLEGKETIGYADTITDIKRIAKHWIENVAEEVAIFYYLLIEHLVNINFPSEYF